MEILFWGAKLKDLLEKLRDNLILTTKVGV